MSREILLERKSPGGNRGPEKEKLVDRKKGTQVRSERQAKALARRLKHLAFVKRVAYAEVDPVWRTIEENYSIGELLRMLPKSFVKRIEKELLLAEIAKRKAAGRHYSDIAARFDKTVRQLINFVQNNKRELDRRIKRLKSRSS